MFRISEWKQILTVKWKMRWKNYLLFLLHTFWLYCLLYYRRFPLLCIKRDVQSQLQINCHFHFLTFPTVSSLLHIREILVHWRNSPNWSLYISFKNELREFVKRSWHFYLGNHFINSHNLSIDNVWILLGENWSWSLLGLKGLMC